MGIPALAWLRSFAAVPIHGHRAGLAASMRAKGLGVDYRVWQQLARLAGADHLHASGLGSKFYETDDEVAANVRSLLEPLGDTITPVPTLSSGQNVTTPGPTYAAVESTDLLMLAGGGVAAHPDGPAAGVQSLRDAWTAAVAGVPLQAAAEPSSRGRPRAPARRAEVRRRVMPTFGFVADDLTGASDVLAKPTATGWRPPSSSATHPCPSTWTSSASPAPPAPSAAPPSTTWSARDLARSRRSTSTCCCTRSARPSTAHPRSAASAAESSCCTSCSPATAPSRSHRPSRRSAATPPSATTTPPSPARSTGWTATR